MFRALGLEGHLVQAKYAIRPSPSIDRFDWQEVTNIGIRDAKPPAYAQHSLSRIFVH